MFICEYLDVRELLATSKSVYYTNKINACEGKQKTIFNVVNNILHRKQAIFPDTVYPDKEMVERFNRRFK